MLLVEDLKGGKTDGQFFSSHFSHHHHHHALHKADKKVELFLPGRKIFTIGEVYQSQHTCFARRKLGRLKLPSMSSKRVSLDEKDVCSRPGKLLTVWVDVYGKTQKLSGRVHGWHAESPRFHPWHGQTYKALKWTVTWTTLAWRNPGASVRRQYWPKDTAWLWFIRRQFQMTYLDQRTDSV